MEVNLISSLSKRMDTALTGRLPGIPAFSRKMPERNLLRFGKTFPASSWKS